jgi:hypothetical protein
MLGLSFLSVRAGAGLVAADNLVHRKGSAPRPEGSGWVQMHRLLLISVVVLMKPPGSAGR